MARGTSPTIPGTVECQWPGAAEVCPGLVWSLATPKDGDRDGPGPPGNCQRLARGAPPSPGLARPVAATHWHLTVALDVRQLELEAAKPPFHWQSQAQPELTQVIIPNPYTTNLKPRLAHSTARELTPLALASAAGH